ncbi:MAG: RNA polymerase sigma-70 factor [Bacteroidales bacterium]|nr:RNA polymerase sigma-70 factor [Bacteroidales bacterium]
MKTELEKVFHQYYSPLCNYASKIVADDFMAEDIVQNLFIQLWENNKLRDAKNIEHFLLRAVKYRCIDYLRTKKAKNEVSFESIHDKRITSENEITEEDIEPLFYYFTAKLPTKTREVFLLSRKSGLLYKEIAIEMGISVKTVENQMGRALRIMKEQLTGQNIPGIATVVESFLKNQGEQ